MSEETAKMSANKSASSIVIIPTYNNAQTLRQVLDGVLEQGLELIVVNDGSTDHTLEVLAHYPQIEVISYTPNRGKGYALRMGLNRAVELGYRYAISIDSDGQHYPADIPIFLAAIEKEPNSLLIGARNLEAQNMPGKNSFANRFSNFWFRLETGIKLADTQSGYRLYPLEKIKQMHFFTGKYEFELEVIVQAAWRSIPVKNVPIRVYYPPSDERISHFRPLRDFTRISLLNSLLVLIALIWYWPWRFFTSLNRKNAQAFIERNITRSPESNTRISIAVGFGVFMGIVPIWGYQMLVAGILAHFLKLNKVITIAASNISIPPMIPFILFGSYATGAWILKKPLNLSLSNISFDQIKDSLFQYIVGSIPFALLAALVAFGLCSLLLKLFRSSPR